MQRLAGRGVVALTWEPRGHHPPAVEHGANVSARVAPSTWPHGSPGRSPHGAGAPQPSQVACRPPLVNLQEPVTRWPSPSEQAEQAGRVRRVERLGQQPALSPPPSARGPG
jgi:hypothetical protein